MERPGVNYTVTIQVQAPGEAHPKEIAKEIESLLDNQSADSQLVIGEVQCIGGRFDEMVIKRHAETWSRDMIRRAKKAWERGWMLLSPYQREAAACREAIFAMALWDNEIGEHAKALLREAEHWRREAKGFEI